MERSGVWTVSANDDFTGLVAQTADDAATLNRDLPEVDGVPVTWQHVDGNPVVPTAMDGRAHGSEPFYGGSRIARGDGGACSTAFKVITAGGNGQMLTADHCNYDSSKPEGISGGLQGIHWHLRQDGTPIGQSTSLDSRGRDAQGIDGYKYGPYVWAGGATSDEVLLPVMGHAPDLIGDGEKIMFSGGFSGTVTHVKIVNNDDNVRYCLDDNNPYCNRHYHFYRVTDTGSGLDAISGQGDSGGPAFWYTNDGNGVRAAGMIAAGYRPSSTTDCPGINMLDATTQRVCYATMWVSPWAGIRDALNVTLDTAP